jgi:hypothetical protein
MKLVRQVDDSIGKPGDSGGGGQAASRAIMSD